MNGILTLLAGLETEIRMMTMGQLLLIVTVFCLRRPPARLLGPLLLLTMGSASYLYLSGPWPFVPNTAGYAMIAFATVLPFSLWLLALSFFDDGFRMPWWGWTIGAVLLLAAPGLEFAGPAERLIRDGYRIAGLAALFHAVWIMLNGLRDDLVEKRRIARLVVVGLVVLLSMTSLIVELRYADPADRAHLEPLSAFVILLLTTGFAATLLQPEGMTLATAATPTAKSGGERKSRPLAAGDPLSKALQVFIAEGRLFQPGLTIAALAEQLQTPEYRLRRTINQGMGFRNFSSFLNHYRIQEAMRRLRDPAMARLPVLTIAMDLGYGSLGPFNRAFRETTGLTPTAWRAGETPENIAEN